MNAQPQNPPAQRRIDIGDPRDLDAWADRLSVDAGALRDAVLLIGDDVEAVELALKGRISSASPH